MNRIRKLASVPPWDHWNAARLKKEKAESPRMFARGFHMKAFTDDERMFPSFTSCYAPGVRVVDISKRGYPVFVGVDLSGPKRPGNAIFVAALDPATQRRYPLEVACGNWTSPETARRINDINMRYPNTRVIMVENNGYQQALIDWVKSAVNAHSFWFKIEAFTTGSNKNAPVIGLPSLEIEFKNKAWVIPNEEFEDHEKTCRCGWCTWTMETKDYPMSATTDTVMAMWFCREGMSQFAGAMAPPLNTSRLNVR